MVCPQWSKEIANNIKSPWNTVMIQVSHLLTFYIKWKSKFLLQFWLEMTSHYYTQASVTLILFKNIHKDFLKIFLLSVCRWVSLTWQQKFHNLEEVLVTDAGNDKMTEPWCSGYNVHYKMHQKGALPHPKPYCWRGPAGSPSSRRGPHRGNTAALSCQEEHSDSPHPSHRWRCPFPRHLTYSGNFLLSYSLINMQGKHVRVWIYAPAGHTKSQIKQFQRPA